jgi:hypothetical protein
MGLEISRLLEMTQEKRNRKRGTGKEEQEKREERPNHVKPVPALPVSRMHPDLGVSQCGTV